MILLSAIALSVCISICAGCRCCGTTNNEDSERYKALEERIYLLESSSMLTSAILAEHKEEIENLKDELAWFKYSFCDSTYTTETGSITPSSYPGYYTEGRICSWNINITKSLMIVLKFDYISLHEDDVLTISDPYGKEVAVVTSKNENVSEIKTDSNAVSVSFKSYPAYSGNRFVLEWETSECLSQNISAENGIIQSLNYPGPYYPNTDCTWVIFMDPNSPYLRYQHWPHITFVELALETGKDILTFYHADGRKIRDYTGFETPPDYDHTPNEDLIIKLRTDGSNNYRGFKIIWEKYYNS